MSRTHSDAKENEIYEYLKSYIKTNGYPPSIREICKSVNLKSTSSVFTYLNYLENRGLITRKDSANRAITLTDNIDIDNNTHKENNSVCNTDIIDIPVVGQVAAGSPILAEENIEDYFSMPASFLSGTSDDKFMLKVKGESMIDCGIYDGDLVICNKTATVSNGEIAVVLVEDSATVKRFYKEDGYYRLQPENEAMEPIIVDECSVLGRVIGLMRLKVH